MNQNFNQYGRSARIEMPDRKFFKFNQFGISNFLLMYYSIDQSKLLKEIDFNNLNEYYDLLHIIILYCKLEILIYNYYRESNIYGFDLFNIDMLRKFRASL
ncbi:hypothetical protein RIR_jg19029.t1 [Rhizophagus irregularis DAOM 181602=DAOM 197198]|uniref:Uncharacterized protein n=1 Tax=Rhizophagus irregularis (strain DAOM 197198w) TaxID=1432141 RepID=A0A015MYX5_RHIIW|nr:hypothetical protein RirG_073480 [Rhizophagus irregularis DAOM 197198w]PKY27713.1 hypothetical protein RhiirB3_19547 [Rhizophagus irregularis]GBC53298.2 hypothetical protein RIR_jg19029.t1 [Rhizophagus irregularis DAOM 181602=DAOM 197198]